MKSRFFFLTALSGILMFGSCNNSKKEVDRLNAVVHQDSVTLLKEMGKDTVIADYVNTLGEIQDNLDSLRIKQKLLSTNLSEGKPGRKDAILDDIKMIDNALIENNKKIKHLEKLLKNMKYDDVKMKKMVANLSKQIEEKNEEIADLHNKLSSSGDSLNAVTERFNESMNEITRQREKLNALTNEYNTIYYVSGTQKTLKEKGVVTKTGGLLGIGRTSQLNSEVNNSSFTKGDLTQLNSIPLNGKFAKLITKHPAGSYKIVADGKNDQFSITDPATFWSESKYLVIQIK